MPDVSPEEAARIRQEFRDAMPPMSDDDWALFRERFAARLRGEPHVHTRLCACDDKPALNAPSSPCDCCESGRGTHLSVDGEAFVCDACAEALNAPSEVDRG